MRTDDLFVGKKRTRLDIVFILDCSGSMHINFKINKAVAGLNEKLDTYKNNKDLDVFVTIATFNIKYKILYNREPIANVPRLAVPSVGGMTYLYGTTVEVLVPAFNEVTNPIQVTMFTDGQDNLSNTSHVIAIKELNTKENYTFIYEGEDANAERVHNTLGISKGNIFSFQDINEVNTARREAEVAYASGVSRGMTKSVSFYNQ